MMEMKHLTFLRFIPCDTRYCGHSKSNLDEVNSSIRFTSPWGELGQNRQRCLQSVGAEFPLLNLVAFFYHLSFIDHVALNANDLFEATLQRYGGLRSVKKSQNACVVFLLKQCNRNKYSSFVHLITRVNQNHEMIDHFTECINLVHNLAFQIPSA